MTTEEFRIEASEPEEKRPLVSAMIRGLRGNCPSCGKTRLFTGGLTVQDTCAVCGEDFHHHRADDLPAYLNIFIVGHIVVALTMIVMDAKVLGLWTLVGLATTVAIAMAVLLMRPLKGMVVGAQWALRMHGFGGDHD